MNREFVNALDAVMFGLDHYWSVPCRLVIDGVPVRPIRLPYVYEPTFDHPLFDYYLVHPLGLIPKALCGYEDEATVISLPIHFDMANCERMFANGHLLLTFEGLSALLGRMFSAAGMRVVRHEENHLLLLRNIGSMLNPKYESHYDYGYMGKTVRTWRDYYDPFEERIVKSGL